MIIIDTEKEIFTVDDKDFGVHCTNAEIKITPDGLPEVILHLVSDVKFKADNCVIQCINDDVTDTAVDSNPDIVDMSVK